MTARAVVAAMTAYTLELRQAEVKLNQNESPYDVPAELKRAALARLSEIPWNRYPDFESTGLREALARYAGVSADNILAGNGSNELLAAAIAAFVGPGVPVVFPRPTFTLYEKLITIAGGLPVPVAFDPATGMLPLDDMLALLDELEGAVVIVCSPNNPTGGVLPADGIDRLLATGATVLYDAAYADFVGEPPEEPWKRGTEELPNGLITFRTFSKAWGLAALRVGWLQSTASTCREIRKVKLPYSLNVLSESLAMEALQRPEIRDGNVGRIVAERSRMLAIMRAIESIDVFPTEANFITFRSAIPFPAFCDRGLLIRNVSSYSGLHDCLRVTIGTRAENDRFLETLKEIA